MRTIHRTIEVKPNSFTSIKWLLSMKVILNLIILSGLMKLIINLLQGWEGNFIVSTGPLWKWKDRFYLNMRSDLWKILCIDDCLVFLLLYPWPGYFSYLSMCILPLTVYHQPVGKCRGQVFWEKIYKIKLIVYCHFSSF
jgi:hypothetical protein